MRRMIVAAAAAAVLCAPPAADATLVYATGAVGADMTIRVARNDGSHAHTLTTGAAPAIAPNGGTVAFQRFAANGTPLYTITTRGGAVRRVATNCASAQWSPDSRLIGCVAQGTNETLEIVDTTSGRVRRLAVGGTIAGLAFSPDSRSIIWGLGDAAFRRVDLWLARVDGSHSHRLIRNAFDPVWAASLLAFDRQTPRGATSAPLFAIWTARPNGTHLRQLTRVGASALLSGLAPVAFGAHTTRLLTNFDGQDTSEAWAVSVPTGVARQLSADPATLSLQAFGLSHDGSAVLAQTGGLGADTTNADVVVTNWSGARLRTLARHAVDPSWNR
jgi:hypothetical protein